MEEQLRRPIVDLEGIGPRIASELEGIEVRVIGDLLRTTTKQVWTAVKHLASVEQVRSWRRMAALLEVYGMEPQWAEAVITAGYISAGAFSRVGLDGARSLFKAAEQAGMIPNVPTDQQVCTMLVSAREVELTGVFVGTVVDGRKKPVAGAPVRVGRRQSISDDRGRLRISGLPLRLPFLVVVDHPAGGCRIAAKAEPREAPVLKTLELSARSVPFVRSQLAGEALPTDLSPYLVKSVEVEHDMIGRGDVLRMIHTYADGRHVKLTSKLLTLKDGELQVHWVKARTEDLPQDLKLGDHIVRTAKGWRKVRMAREQLRAYKAVLRTRAHFKGQPAPTTAADKKARMEDVMEHLFDQLITPRP
ncbi:MAG: DUF4332 domain-containing protein [Flavobacteriales bacterium]